VLAGATLAFVRPPAVAGTQQAADEVIALERMALDKWSKGDPSGFLAIYSDSVTYFDPFQERRVDGMPAIRAMLAPIAGTFKIDRYEIRNPKVQGNRDVVVLSYNLQNYMRQPDGTERPTSRWNSSSVYRRANGTWKVIQSHWSFTKPDLRPPAP
jgi:uncharacterized protein (TIGR02246 family)